MLKIKDYLDLKEIYDYLKTKKNEMVNENNGFSNRPIMDIEKLIIKLDKILKKLESEGE